MLLVNRKLITSKIDKVPNNIFRIRINRQIK